MPLLTSFVTLTAFFDKVEDLIATCILRGKNYCVRSNSLEA